MKNYFTYIGGFVVIVLVGAGVLWGVQEYRYRKSPEYQAMKYFEDIKKRYENDTYGGVTPEETLQLFVDALKKGDIELASRYFVVEKQEEKLAELKIGKEKGNLEKIINLLEKTNYSSKYPDGKAYDISIVEKDNTIKFSIHLVWNDLTKKWKIESL